jgi:hypothetical protein
MSKKLNDSALNQIELFEHVDFVLEDKKSSLVKKQIEMFSDDIINQNDVFCDDKDDKNNKDDKEVFTDIKQALLFSGEESTSHKEINIFIQKSFDEKSEKKLSNKIDLEKEVYSYQTKNCSDSFDRLYNHFKPHFERISFQKQDEDLRQELSEVLWNAALKYRFDVNVKFKTFFWTCVHNHIGTKKIRQNAKKRSGKTTVFVKTYNDETGIFEQKEQVIVLNNVSLNAKIKTEEDSGAELGSFIESEMTKQDYNSCDFDICLKYVLASPELKSEEKTAITMFLQGYTLRDIGKKLGGLTPAAIHFMIRRLGEKKVVRDNLIHFFIK